MNKILTLITILICVAIALIIGCLIAQSPINEMPAYAIIGLVCIGIAGGAVFEKINY